MKKAAVYDDSASWPQQDSLRREQEVIDIGNSDTNLDEFHASWKIFQTSTTDIVPYWECFVTACGL
jgi:hypothetical protein